MKNFAGFLILIYLLVIVVIATREDGAWYVDMITRGYHGIIVEKKMGGHGMMTMSVKTKAGDTLVVPCLYDQLRDSSRVGDSIAKIPNENYVFLKRGTSVSKFWYLYVPENARSGRKWPKEWTTKWPESSR